MLGRRPFVAAGMAAIGSGVLGLPAARGRASEEKGIVLRQLAAEKGLVYGTTIAAAQITGDPAFIDLVREQAGLVVAENEMKWLVMNRGAPGDDDYGPADTIANFANANHLVLRGHNLLWY
ncbi:MAG: endo-1,4-beta-xylanase, partial [Alphaproteobacteria bacterium]|nr:endo-1,4-beta-xylanase [Alphaproteobacteria bacterium]